MKPESNTKWISTLESIGVGMRILSFGTLSIMNENTPFLVMWIINTIDALILTYCAYRRENPPYIALNVFWLIVGIVGIWNSWQNPMCVTVVMIQTQIVVIIQGIVINKTRIRIHSIKRIVSFFHVYTILHPVPITILHYIMERV